MSVVANGSFESTIRDDVSSPPQPLSYGNWASWQSFGSVNRPTRVTTAAHDGTYSCRIQATSGTGSGGWILQDFTSAQVDPLQGFYFSAWVNPVQGDEQMQLLFDYDRGPGTSVAYVNINIWNDHTDCSFLGQNNPTAPAVPFDGNWHNVVIRGWPDLTTDLIIDNVVKWTSLPGTLPAYSVATVIFGEGTGGSHPRVDDFYWDDISLDFNPFPLSTSQPPLRQRQRLINTPRMRQGVR